MATVDHDCSSSGARFAGLRALIEARRQGLSLRLIDDGSEVGGGWSRYRYPGARSDSESWVYCYSFDAELLQSWAWPDRCPAREDVAAYLSHVADRYDLRRDIQLENRVERAVWDDTASVWAVQTDGGEQLRCRHLVLAPGGFSAPYEPFPGAETYRGEYLRPAQWPAERVDFTGRRVGVVGTGSTGAQLIPQLAHSAEHLTVFQRTANFVVPVRNHPLDEAEREAIKRDYPAIWDLVRANATGYAIEPVDRVLADLDEPEVHRVLERAWELGGAQFLLGTFADVMVDRHSNDVVSGYVRDKIRSIVRDPATADLLSPKDHPVLAKRPVMGHGYYEAYNRPNVSLVDVRSRPIETLTETGLRLEDGTEHPLDVIVMATGFDAATGGFTAVDIRDACGSSSTPRGSPRARRRTATCSAPTSPGRRTHRSTSSAARTSSATSSRPAPTTGTPGSPFAGDGTAAAPHLTGTGAVVIGGRGG